MRVHVSSFRIQQLWYDMMYTGALHRAFQLPFAHEVEPKACTRRLAAATCIWPMRNLRVWRDEITGHNTGISLVLLTGVRVLLSTPIECWETGPTAFRPRPQMVWWKKVPQSSILDQAESKPETSWMAARALTNCANLAHTVKIHIDVFLLCVAVLNLYIVWKLFKIDRIQLIAPDQLLKQMIWFTLAGKYQAISRSSNA